MRSFVVLVAVLSSVLAQTSVKPTTKPTSKPTIKPTSKPTAVVTSKPTSPTLKPTTGKPTTTKPTAPTSKPTAQPTTAQPTTPFPTELPSWSPTTYSPTLLPTELPTVLPTMSPNTLAPTMAPTAAPTNSTMLKCGGFTDADCQAMYNKLYVCQDALFGSAGCYHKKLFGNPGWVSGDTIATISIMLLFGFTAAAGTGGGGVLVPLFIACEKFIPKDAVAISQATIFGGAVANLIWNVRLRHPQADRPMICLELGLMMEPTTLAGTVAGTLFNRILPSWLLLVLLVLLLGATFIRSTQGALKKRRAELAARETEVKIDLDDMSPENEADIVETKPADGTTAEIVVVEEKEGEKDDDEPTEITTKERPCHGQFCSKPRTLKEVLDFERFLSARYVLIYVACWFGILIFSAMKGGVGGTSIAGISCGEPWFWFLTIIIFPISVVLQYVLAKYFIGLEKRKVALNFPFLKNDIRWSRKMCFLLPGVSYLIGCLAGMLGIGGGLFKAPLLNEMGIDPVVSGATCAFMIFFTSSISMSQYIIYKVLKVDYAMWFGFTGFVASLCGQWLNSFLTKRMGGGGSRLMFTVAAVVGLSTLMLTIQGVSTVRAEIAAGQLGLSPLCLAKVSGGGE